MVLLQLLNQTQIWDGGLVAGDCPAMCLSLIPCNAKKTRCLEALEGDAGLTSLSSGPKD